MTDPATIGFLDLPFASLSLDEALDATIDRAGNERFSYIVTPNVDHVVGLDRAPRTERGAAITDAYAAAALVLCDSTVLARLARLSGLILPVVRGSDLTEALLADPRLAGRRVALIGGSATLPAALARVAPSIGFVQHRPPMGVLNDEAGMAAIEAFVAAERADFVIFAIGAPQSEVAAHRCLTAGRSRGVALCAGASLEFVVGEKRRAPHWMRRTGTEWAFRLGCEPRRLWRRYLLDGPRVFWIWARQSRRQKPSPGRRVRTHPCPPRPSIER